MFIDNGYLMQISSTARVCSDAARSIACPSTYSRSKRSSMTIVNGILMSTGKKNTLHDRAASPPALSAPECSQRNTSRGKKDIKTYNNRQMFIFNGYLTLTKYDSIVRFTAGRMGMQQTFFARKAIACNCSPVFKAAFNEGFLEGQTQHYYIDDTDPQVFQILVQWMYYRGATSKVSGTSNEKLFILSQLWVLAGKYMIPRLQNHAIDSIRAIQYKSKPLIQLEAMHWVYENAGPGSPLRAYIVAITARHRGMEYVRDDGSSFPTELLVELATYLMKYSRSVAELKLILKDVRAKDFHVPEENGT
ncbi:uncharacterized protein PAC_14330 [Phialocephala subalpina]|uniref:BTB domain-containing protein n=1 Tax=Phialocephala subalpina TaxID=576137 RepID=A0A1L7XHC5_9HELO|nr:uncharacterized protein PAC_14330 [Phialocephala subalpina]